MTVDEVEIRSAQSEIGEAIQRVLDDKAIDASVREHRRWQAMLALVTGLGVGLSPEMAGRVHREACALVEAFERGEADGAQ